MLGFGIEALKVKYKGSRGYLSQRDRAAVIQWLLIKDGLFFTNDLGLLYDKLTKIAINLFQSSWLKIRDGKINPQPQPVDGSVHRLRDRERYQHLLINGWDTPVVNLIGKALNNVSE
jgi:methionyl-tRNA formyltransferase